jgi:hypothetical protein
MVNEASCLGHLIFFCFHAKTRQCIAKVLFDNLIP